MRFAIIEGKPYLISNGMAIPVEIEGTSVTLYEQAGFISGVIGTYTLAEIRAKFGDVSSYEKPVEKPKKAKPKKAVTEEVTEEVEDVQ